MFDPAVLTRLIDLAAILIGASVLIGAYQLIAWKLRQTRAWQNREHARMQRRILAAANDWPTNVQPIRRPVSLDLDKAA